MGFISKKYFVRFCYSLIFFIVSSSGVFAQKVNDSSFITDSPVLAQLDSLAAASFFKQLDFTTDVSKLNKYNFPSDSVPVYEESVYRERIEKMNVASPFEYLYNEQVRAYIDLYSAKRKKLTSRMLGLGALYFPLFEEQLDKYDLPLEFKYLAIIESAMNPIARSRAGATGLWQFMLNTGKLYDLKVTSYVDDRCDPYKATVAACRHLRDLYNIYGDWFVVLAAYNAGPGTVNRAIRNAGLDSNQIISYWKIQNFLPRETQAYVPAFIGVSFVMHYAAEHNIYPSQPPLMFKDIDTVVIYKSVTFNQLSSFLCIPYETLQLLNPSYRKGIIPATQENSYVLCLPRQYIADFLNNKEAVCNYKTPEEVAHEEHLRQVSTTKTVTTSGTENKTVVNTDVKTSNTVNRTSYDKYVYHTVQKGDSLWSIAGKYKGSSVDEIRRLNNLSAKAVIYPGQKLKVGVKG